MRTDFTIVMFLLSTQLAIAQDAGTAKIVVGQTVITAETNGDADAETVILVALEKTVAGSQWIKYKHLPYWLLGIGAFTFMAIALLRKRGLLPTGRAVTMALAGASAAVAAGSLIFAGVQPAKGLGLAFGPWLAMVFQEVGKALGLVGHGEKARAEGARPAVPPGAEKEPGADDPDVVDLGEFAVSEVTAPNVIVLVDGDDPPSRKFTDDK